MNITKTAKRFFQILFVLLILIVGAAVAIPYFFKDQIVARVKEDINKNLNAEVDFADVSLSLLRSFPNFSFGIEGLSITGVDDFAGVNLTKADQLRFTLDLQSVISSERPIEILEAQIDQPDINILVLRDGRANYDIVKPSETEETTSSEAEELSFVVQLQEFGIENGKFKYIDKSADIAVDFEGIDHEGRGDFTQDIFDLFTQTQIGSMTVNSGGINYLYQTKGDFDITLNADLPKNTYTLKDNTLKLNDLNLQADGAIQLIGAAYGLDLNFKAPQNDFKSFLSLIPHAYTADYAAVQASGKLQLQGEVKGTLDLEKEEYPAFKIGLAIDNGSFKYPDLPLGINGIFTKANINSPSSNFDRITVDIPQLKLLLGDHPFEGRFALKTPISDPDIDTQIKGLLDLKELSDAFPMEDVGELSGRINADLTAVAKMSDLDRQNYDEVNMKGNMQVDGLNYAAPGLPRVKIRTLDMDFNPRRVEVANMDMNLGKSDLKGSGSIDNILAYFSPDKTMTGDFTLRSDLFDANEWLVEEETASAAPAAEAPVAEETAVFDRFKFTLDAQVGRLLYDVYEIKQSALKGSVSPSEAVIDNFKLLIGPSDIAGSGKLTNIFNYLYEEETLGGKIALRSRLFDLNPFMEETEAGATAKNISEEELEPFLVPDNIDIQIDADVDKVLYTDLALNDLNGRLNIKDEAIRFEDCQAKTLGGVMKINGGYNTQDETKPGFDLEYAIQSFDFQKAFRQFNTFAQLAPIAKFIEGNFSSKMSFAGTLGQDLSPVFNDINADGFFQTVNSVIRGFEPLEKIGNQLNIDLFKKLTIKDTKNWFEVKDGKVTVKEFKLEQQGIDMLIGGSHSLDQDMDYNIKAKIPRALLDKAGVGQIADKGIGFLKKEAGKAGLNIDVGEFINVLINVTGSVSDPKVGFKVLGSGGEKSIVEQTKEVVKEAVEEKVEEVKEEVIEKVEDKKKELQAKMDAEIKAIMGTAEKQAQKIREGGKKAGAEARKLADQQANNLIKEAGRNPIKKKVAETTAKAIRKKADQQATKLETEANKKADGVMSKAQQEVDKVRKRYAEM